MGLGAVAASTLGSAAIGAGTSLIGSGKAASAAQDAANLQMQMYQQNVNRMTPWVNMGQGVIPNMLAAAPDTMTTTEMQNMPGYQFMLDQGLKTTQSSAAARGLGVSGAALKGAATYTQGLADQTYQQLFQQKQQQFQNLYNISGQGESAAAGVGTAGTQAAATAGGQTAASGLYAGQGIQGIGSAATGAAQNYLDYSLLQQNLHPQTAGYPTGAAAMNPSNINLNPQTVATNPITGY